MKKCPYCAEEIQDEAIKCKHCKEPINPSKDIYGYCTDCRAPLNKDSKFCPACGVIQIGSSSNGDYCTDCKSPLNMDSNFCPACGVIQPSISKTINHSKLDESPNKGRAKRTKVAIALIFGLIVIYNLGSCPSKHSSTESSSSSTTSGPDYAAAARWACHEYLKESLKVPSTANIPSHTSFESRYVPGGTTLKYDVVGEFEAQNSFGAMLRSKFICRVEKDPDLKDAMGEAVWHLISIDIK